MAVLEKTAFGELFDKLNISGSLSEFELWGAMSRAYARHAQKKFSNGFTLHAFIGEKAADTGFFVNIEMRELAKLAKESSPISIDFYAVAAAIGNPNHADLRFKKQGQQAACAYESADVTKAPAAMGRMRTAAEKKNNERRGKTPDTGEASPGSSS